MAKEFARSLWRIPSEAVKKLTARVAPRPPAVRHALFPADPGGSGATPTAFVEFFHTFSVTAGAVMKNSARDTLALQHVLLLLATRMEGETLASRAPAVTEGIHTLCLLR